MAFENLEPHRKTILGWRDDGLTLNQITTRLAEEHQVSTSPGSLSRYLREINPQQASPRLNPSDRQLVDMVTLLTEILAEVRGRGDEQRMAAEHLAGQVRILTEVIDETTGARPPNPGRQRSRWGFWPGFLAGIAVSASAAALGYAQLSGWLT